MESFDGRVAVVTGGASGIGLGTARALAAEGAHLVLADVDPDRLVAAVDELAGGGADGTMTSGRRVLGVPTDVTRQDSVDRLADRAYHEFGAVHLLHNNAGVFAAGASWEATDDDWDWLWNVNVKGIVHGIRAFVPRMLDGGEEGHVVNTASMAGLVASPASAVYTTTKYAAVGLSECLHHDLSLIDDCRIGVSVVCPSVVATDIGRSDRGRPASLADGFEGESADLAHAGLAEAMTGPSARSPDAAGARIVAEVKAGRFYVTTHDSYDRLVANQNEDRLEGRAPRFQMFD